MDQENQNVDEGVSLGEICSFIWRKKVLLFISTILIILLVVIVNVFYISPNSKDYSIKFTYDNVHSLNKNHYIDGTPFSYRDIISKESLDQVKNSNDAYKNIDVNSLFNNSKFTIKETRITQDPEDLKTELLGIEYEIIAPANYFETYDLAKNFFIDLVNVPILKNNEILDNLDYDYNLKSIEQSETYDLDFLLLDNQINLIKEGYQSLINTFGQNLIVYITDDNGNSSPVYIAQLLNTLNTNTLTTYYQVLKSEYELYPYLKDYNDANNLLHLETEIRLYDEKLNRVENKISAIKNTIEELKNSNINYGESLTNLVTELNNLKIEQSNLASDKKVASDLLSSYKGELVDGKNFKEDTDKFDAKLNEVINEVTEHTEVFTNVYKDTIKNFSKVDLLNRNIISVSGSNSFLIYAVGVIGAIGFSAVLAGIIGYNETKREKKEEKIEG